jgi:hypothetical protein
MRGQAGSFRVMSRDRKAGAIEKAIGYVPSMVTATPTAMTMHGKTIMITATGTTIATITEMVTITTTNSIGD